MTFTNEQVKELCNGLFPDNGFDWNSVHHWRLHNVDIEPILEPYDAMDLILPAPGIKIIVEPTW